MRGSDRHETVRRDLISHFTLRLAYCRTEDLRRWFVDFESELLRFRFSELTTAEQHAFLARNGLAIRVVTEDEFIRHRDDLALSVQCYNSGIDFGRVKQASGRDGAKLFFKVPFERVCELVRTRHAFLFRGEAFVPYNQVAPLVVGHFKKAMAAALATTAKAWTHVARMEESLRLAPIVEGLSQQYLGPDYSKAGAAGTGAEGEIRPASLNELPQLAQRHYPLCMRHLDGQLRENRHLRHMGRMQFGLFLKGIGLPLDEALMFWKASFAPKISAEKFNKQYAYSVRHNYGKEGKRADYTPYTCMKIISATPGAGEHHGCPYKTFGEESLRTALQQMHVGGGDVQEIVGLAKGHHFQLACARTFQATHGVPADEGINHPNQYYDLSRTCCARNDAALAPATPVGAIARGKPGPALAETPLTVAKTPTPS